MMSQRQDEILALLPFRRGHFRMESGHHGDLWVDLEILCLDPQPVRRLAVEIAGQLSKHKPEMLCGPLIEGAFVALMVATELALPFCYSEKLDDPRSEELYPVSYRIPGALRAKLRGKRVAIVNDVINAGSAVRGTFADLEACGAQPVAIGSLLVFGTWASDFAARQNMELETLASLPNTLWTPAECPLCSQNIPLIT